MYVLAYIQYKPTSWPNKGETDCTKNKENNALKRYKGDKESSHKETNYPTQNYKFFHQNSIETSQL